MKKSIFNMILFAAAAALFCVTCNDSGTDSQSPKWAGDVDKFLRSLDAAPPAATPATYAATVSSAGIGSSGGGSYAAGSTVAIYAGTAPSGQAFKNWTSADGVAFADADSATTTFTMPANAATVTAVFEAIYLVTVTSAGTGYSGGGNYAEGATVTISAGTPPSGQAFKNWTTSSNGATLADATGATTTFTMPANAVAVTAVFEAQIVAPAMYAVAVSSAGTGFSGGGSYAAGATVAIKAGTAPTGQVFKNWTTASGGVTFANADDETTTFTMPANAVTVTAVFAPDVNYGTLNDVRDGKTYKTVEIGGRTWMAENLNYETKPGEGDSWCYGDRSPNCETYGRLYDWNTALDACPKGWRLPSREEWVELAVAAGDNAGGTSGAAGTKLKSKSGWSDNGNGTDDFGFSALPGGIRLYNGGFSASGSGGYWWSATAANNRDYAYARNIFSSRSNLSEGSMFVNYCYSVRCVQDKEASSATVTTYLVTVSSAGTGSSSGGNFVKGTTVKIKAGTPPTGQQFKKWTTTSDGVSFAYDRSSTTTFTMPANAVTVTANFRQKPPDGDGGTLKYDDQEYRTVIIDGERWMAENLNIETADSWCYGNSADNCAKYGRLYTWAAAMSACPNGWRLPDTVDWNRLVKAAGDSSVAGRALKSTSGWSDGGNGTDEFGFSALPGGTRYSDGLDRSIVNTGSWWTATEQPGGNAYRRLMSYSDDRVSEYYATKNYGCSVRCVED